MPVHVDVIIITFCPTVLPYPKAVSHQAGSVARPLCGPTILSPDLDIHRLHDHFQHG
jgi:hypothetical protein